MGDMPVRNLVAELMAREPDRWLDILVNDYKIQAVRSAYAVSLKYNQLESPMAEPIVQQCRGMVVDSERRAVMAWGYDKFWNLGETMAAPIDWASARVQEKLDGSLMQLYWDEQDCRWNVATSGHPTANGSFGASDITFREAFWRTYESCDLELPPDGWKGATFLFELCDTPNRVVVQHDEPRLVLHGARRIKTGVEAQRGALEAIATMLGAEIVREFPIASAAECLAAADALNPLEQEGFVVVDRHFNRVKVKSPRYVILHHMKGEATRRRAIELWQTGETAELLAHFPEMAATIQPVQDELDRIAEQAARDFAENLPRPTRKDFALAVKDLPWSAVLFRMLGDQAPGVESAKAIMRRMSLPALERMVLPGGGE